MGSFGVAAAVGFAGWREGVLVSVVVVLEGVLEGLPSMRDAPRCGMELSGRGCEQDRVMWDGEESSFGGAASFLIMSGSISDDSRSTSSSSNAVPLTSKGLPFRRLIFFSPAIVAGPKAADSLLSSAVSPSSGDGRKRRNSAAASFEMLSLEIPLAALTMLGIRLAGASSGLEELELGLLDDGFTVWVDG
jgi:hypothetical protein